MGHGARAHYTGVLILLQLSVFGLQEVEVGADEDFPPQNEDPYH